MEEKKKNAFDKIVTVILLAIVLALAAIVAKSMLEKKPQQTPRQAMDTTTTINVSVKDMQPETFIKTTTVGAEIVNKLSTYSLTSDVGGKITKLFVEKNQKVKKGDIIAYVDPSVAGSKYKEQPVVSSLDGTLSSVDVYVGQTITTSTAIATVGDVGDLEITAQLPERYLSVIKTGTDATFTTAAWPEETLHATIKSISTEVNKTNRTFTVTLTLDQDKRLKAGMYLTLTFVTEQKDDVFIIPTTAISSYLEDKCVYVVNGTAADRRTVEIDESYKGNSIISSGIIAGDKVIVKGSVTQDSQISIVE